MFNSSLFDQDIFYRAFLKYLNNAHDIVIIESPFITKKRIGVEVFMTVGHHRKLAITDSSIILQNDSCEIMYRISLRGITLN